MMEVDEADNSLGVSFVGTDGIMLAAHDGANVVEQFGRVGRGRIGGSGRFFQAQIKRFGDGQVG